MSDKNDNTEVRITNIKLYVLIVTLSTEDNVKLTKQLNEGFKGHVYWNQYKTKIGSTHLDNNNPLRINDSFQGVKRLFVLAFGNTNNGNKKFERDSHKK